MSEYSSPVSLTVKSARLLDEDDTLKHAKLVEDMLAKPIPMPAQAPVPAPEPEQEITEAPTSMAPSSPFQHQIGAGRQPQHDYKIDLADARTRSNDNHFIANTTNAVDTLISKATGTRASDFGNQLNQQADQPLDDLKMEVDLDKFNSARQKEADLDDPASRTSAIAREQYKQLDPKRAAMYGPDFERMTARDLERAFGVTTKDMQLDNAIEKAMIAARGKDADRGEKARQFDVVQPREDLKANTGTVNATAALLNARKMPDSSTVSGAQQAVAKRRVGDRIIDYAKKTEKLGDSIVALEQIDRLAPGMARGVAPGGSVSGDGAPAVDWTKIKDAVLKKGLGQQFTEPQAQALRSSVMMFKGQIRYLLAGAQLTDYEANYYDQAFADSLLSPPAVQAAVLDMFRNTLYRKIARYESAYRNTIEAEEPGRWGQYSKEPGAVTSSHVLFSDLAQTQGRPQGQPTGPGQQTPPLPTATPVREPAPAGSKRVRRRGDQGRGKIVPADKIAIFLNNPNFEILDGP